MAAPLPFYQDPQLYRPQTWLLLLAAICACLPLYLPLYTFVLPASQTQLWVYLHRLKMSDAGARLGLDWSAYLLAALALVGALLTLLATGSFRNRKVQVNLITFAIIFLVVATLGRSWSLYELATDPNGMLALDPGLYGTPGIGLYGMIGAVLLLIIARQLVVRDQQRIKNMNRFWS